MKQGIIANRDPTLEGLGPWLLKSPDSFSCVPTCIDGLLGTNLRHRKEGGYDLDKLLEVLDILQVPWLLGRVRVDRLIGSDYLRGIIAVGSSGMGHACYKPYGCNWVDPKDGSRIMGLQEVDAYVYVGYGQR